MHRLRLRAAFSSLVLAGVLFGSAAAAVAQGGATQRERPIPLTSVNTDRWEADIRKFEAADRTAPPPKNGVVFVGSSSIVRWNLVEAFPELGAKAINRGFGGSVMSDAAYYADRIVVPYAPRIVVLYSGDNDIVTDATPARIAGDAQKFSETVHRALPDTDIVVIGIKPSVQRWAQVEKARAANVLMRQYCEGHPHMTYVDVDKAMLSADGKPRPELYVQDGLHMTPAGYAIWNAIVHPLLKLQ